MDSAIGLLRLAIADGVHVKEVGEYTIVNIFHLSAASSLISADYHVPYAQALFKVVAGFATTCAFLAYTGAYQVENVYKN